MKKIFKYILIIISIIFTIYYLINYDLAKILTSISLIPLIYIPNILKIKISDKLLVIYYIYLTILLVLGCLFNLYNIITFYDDIAHFINGIVSSIFICFILKKYKAFNNPIFIIISIIMITLGISALWELFEYFTSILFNLDIQHVIDTGVTDTIIDILMSFIASIMFSLYYIKDKKLSWI